MKNTAQKKILALLALVFTLTAIGVHLYLNKHHIDLKLGVATANSICNINENLNCDAAASSRFSELFGIPMALLGAFTNGLLLIFILLGRYNLTSDNDRTERFAFYISSFIFLVSVIMGGISFFVIRVGCPFCIATYALSILTWIVLFIAYRPDLGRLPEDLRDLFTTEKWVLGLAIAVPVLALIVNNMTLDSYGYQEIKRVSENSLSTWQNAPLQNFDSENGLIFQNGSGEAKVTIVEFADFLCSHCKAAYPALHSFAKTHPDVKLIFKNFPLDGVCNTAVSHKGDGKRCELAYAALCAEKISKKGWDTHHYIFDNQESIFSKPMPEVTAEICKTTGVDCEQLKSCMNTEEIHEAVRKMASEGEKAQISGTPAIFLNNKNLPGGQLPPVLENTYREISK
jgi:protein-disulfide isomerase/uncharacterized membrane protein